MLLSIVFSTLLAALSFAAPLQGRDELGMYEIEWRAAILSEDGFKPLLGHVMTHDGTFLGKAENGNKLGMWANGNQGEFLFSMRPVFEFDPSIAGQVKSVDSELGIKGTHCLDATECPDNGVVPHMWDCHDGLMQQQWRFRADGLIELDGTGLCLDYKDGQPRPEDLVNNTQATIQLWDCIPHNTNQQWDITWRFHATDSPFRPAEFPPPSDS